MGSQRSLDEEGERTSLDMLENEDRRILALSAQMDDTHGTEVTDRADYGNQAKLLIRHFAAREAAVLDVVDGLRRAGSDGCAELADRFAGDMTARRNQMDVVEKMSRGVQGLYLNTGQPFDEELGSLMEIIRPDIEWDLEEGIPRVRSELGEEGCAEVFHDADHVARHAPTNLSPTGPAWWERAPVVSRLVTIVQHLRDYPRATRDART